MLGVPIYLVHEIALSVSGMHIQMQTTQNETQLEFSIITIAINDLLKYLSSDMNSTQIKDLRF